MLSFVHCSKQCCPTLVTLFNYSIILAFTSSTDWKCVPFNRHLIFGIDRNCMEWISISVLSHLSQWLKYNFSEMKNLWMTRYIHICNRCTYVSEIIFSISFVIVKPNIHSFSNSQRFISLVCCKIRIFGVLCRRLVFNSDGKKYLWLNNFYEIWRSNEVCGALCFNGIALAVRCNRDKRNDSILPP